MPIYEYICGNCGQEIEVIQKFSDDPLKECSACRQPSLEKKTSVSAFHLKGGGWYKDGYGSSKKSSAESDSASGKSKTDSEKKSGAKDVKPSEKKSGAKDIKPSEKKAAPSSKAS